MFGANDLTGRILGGVPIGAGLLAVLLGRTLAWTPTPASGWTPTVVAVASPARSNSGESQLTVSPRGVLLSWLEREGTTLTLRFAERMAAGWTEPRTVASGKNWSINPFDVPSVLRLADNTLAAHWLEKDGSGMHANDVRLSYSKDDGRTWATSFMPHQSDSQAERLFPSLFQVAGGLGLIWLEGGMMGQRGRAQTTAPNHPTGANHVHPPASGQRGHDKHAEHGPTMASGAMSVRFASFDTAWKPTANMTVDPRVCECCSTAAVITSDGVLAAYRNRSDEEIRDIYVSRFEQGRWTEPAVAHADNWQIPACPINGPALSADGRNVAIVWYTVKQDQGQAYAAFSRDAGRTFSKAIRLDDAESLGRVDVELLPDGSAFATWIEFADGHAQFRGRRVTVDGERSAPVTIAALAATRASGYPRLARHGGELVFAWTETNPSAAASAKAESGTIKVRTAVAKVPSSLTPR